MMGAELVSVNYRKKREDATVEIAATIRADGGDRGEVNPVD
jgi:hypothetical protein